MPLLSERTASSVCLLATVAAALLAGGSASPLGFFSRPPVQESDDAVAAVAAAPKQQQQPGAAAAANEAAAAEAPLLGQLEQLNVVGVAAHPTAAGKVLYADETSIYELDTATRAHRRLAGAATSGLLAGRQAVDGRGLLARFVYITKLVVRGSRVFVFDNDRLRELSVRTLAVRTLTLLSTEPRSPVTGAVTWDASHVYWFGTAGAGHAVMRMSLARPQLSRAEFVTGGGSLVAYADVTADGRYLLLSDVEANALQRVDLTDGTVVTARSSSGADDDGFAPGAVATRRNGDIVVVNSEQRTVELVRCAKDERTDEVECAVTRTIGLSNPQDIAVSVDDASALVLDSAFHAQLPTYEYFIKRVQF